MAGQITQAIAPPTRAVINCVVEKVMLAALTIGAGKLVPNVGMITLTITMLINNAFKMELIIIDGIKMAISLFVSLSGRLNSMAIIAFLTKAIDRTRISFPAIIQGIIIGNAAITGAPVIKNDVIGVIIAIIEPQSVPQYSVVIIRMVLIIGPVMYTDKFLKN